MSKPAVSRQLSIPNLGKGYGAFALLSAPTLGRKKSSVRIDLLFFGNLHAIAPNPVSTRHAGHGEPSKDIVFKNLLIDLRGRATGATHAIAVKIG